MLKKINSSVSFPTDLTSDVNPEQLKVNSYNKLEDAPDKYYNCPKCKNKELVAVLDADGNFTTVMCDCKPIRQSIKRAEKSGLKKLLDLKTLDCFTTTEKWQEGIKFKATEYTKQDNGSWFYIGGQKGSGKSHLCTAMVGEFIKQGKDALYMLWRDKVVELKANVNNFNEYDRLMQEYKNVKVLYIDDFYKTDSENKPTQADKNIAFELLNFRYNNPDSITIISSELQIRDLLAIDEAVGSRIYERSKDYQINIAPDINKNYRLR